MNILESTTLCTIDLSKHNPISRYISMDGTRLVTVNKDSMDIWYTSEGDHLIQLNSVEKIPVNISFAPDGFRN